MTEVMLFTLMSALQPSGQNSSGTGALTFVKASSGLISPRSSCASSTGPRDDRAFAEQPSVLVPRVCVPVHADRQSLTAPDLMLHARNAMSLI